MTHLESEKNLVKIEIRPDAEPINSRWYFVPRIDKRGFKIELEGLEKIGVLE